MAALRRTTYCIFAVVDKASRLAARPRSSASYREKLADLHLACGLPAPFGPPGFARACPLGLRALHLGLVALYL